MIPIHCPNCGVHREVPFDRLNRPMKCRECQTVFYMDNTGSLVIGRPGEAIKGKKKHRKADTGPALDFNFDLKRTFREMPKPVKVGAAALVALALIGYGASALVGAIAGPSDLKGRARRAAELYVDNKLDDLKAMALPETAADLATWYEQTRGLLHFDGPRKSSSDVAIDVGILAGDEASGKARVFVALLVINPDRAEPPGEPEPGRAASALSYSPETSWVRQGGQWLIDGKATLQGEKSRLEGEAINRENRRRRAEDLGVGRRGR